MHTNACDAQSSKSELHQSYGDRLIPATDMTEEDEDWRDVSCSNRHGLSLSGIDAVKGPILEQLRPTLKIYRPNEEFESVSPMNTWRETAENIVSRQTEALNRILDHLHEVSNADPLAKRSEFEPPLNVPEKSIHLSAGDHCERTVLSL